MHDRRIIRTKADYRPYTERQDRIISAILIGFSLTLIAVSIAIAALL